MKRSFEKAKKAVERLFRDTCFVETFSEETAAWGESLHEKGEGETFPCRLTEKAEVCGTDGLLTQTEKNQKEKLYLGCSLFAAICCEFAIKVVFHIHYLSIC